MLLAVARCFAPGSMRLNWHKIFLINFIIIGDVRFDEGTFPGLAALDKRPNTRFKRVYNLRIMVGESTKEIESLLSFKVNDKGLKGYLFKPTTDSSPLLSSSKA